MFEAKDADRIHGSNFKHTFIQCSKCGAVVGVTDYFNVVAMLEKLAKSLNVPPLA